MELKDFEHKPYANGSLDYSGQYATIETNGSYTLPWSIVLEDRRRLANCGSMATAQASFNRFGLRYR